MWTEHQLEIAARKLCEMRGQNPDEICEQSRHRVNNRMVNRTWLQNYIEVFRRVQLIQESEDDKRRITRSPSGRRSPRSREGLGGKR